MSSKDYKRITTNTLSEMKVSGEKIAMLTAYDFTLAGIIDKAGIDVILVGDSASNVMAGHETTLPITLEQIIYHASSVIRAVKRALVVVDLPFGTYQSDSKEALRSAIKIMKESGAHAVKLEGGSKVVESIERILQAGIPVMGHLGLLPQTAKKYSVQGKTEDDAEILLEDSKSLEAAGCFTIVYEMVASETMKKITGSVNVPTIGIGCGKFCDGQVLVIHDMLGLYDKINPKFVKRYLSLSDPIRKAVSEYIDDVESQTFPAEEHSYHMESQT